MVQMLFKIFFHNQISFQFQKVVVWLCGCVVVWLCGCVVVWLWTLLRRTWVQLNCLRTSVGRFRSCLYKWDMASHAACECGAE